MENVQVVDRAIADPVVLAGDSRAVERKLAVQRAAVFELQRVGTMHRPRRGVVGRVSLL